ncbi:hypothetical protein FFU37_11525 [Pseudoalteromonas distincta]|uniref:Uncharacterized protein n=1 Tax=Pseudoalteromonas distincta TaxID=77608 RepID=A0A4P9J3D6_9GAMM|nr:hypothetical protein FFU37_11525 [Pseudoalteromonas distincta]
MGDAFGLTNLPFDVGRISGKATPSYKNDELTRNNSTRRVLNHLLSTTSLLLRKHFNIYNIVFCDCDRLITILIKNTSLRVYKLVIR